MPNFRLVNQRQQIFNFPNVVSQTVLHRRGDAKRLMNPTIIIIHNNAVPHCAVGSQLSY